MKYLNDFIIAFSGLAPGEHHFSFEVDDAFFGAFEYPEIGKAGVTVGLVLDKQPSMLVLNFEFRGWVECVCDRCAEEYQQPVQGLERLIVKFSDEASSGNDDIIILSDRDHQIDIRQYVYEFIVLLLPARRVHPDLADGTAGCNPETLKRLEELRSHTGQDPRWDALKNIT